MLCCLLVAGALVDVAGAGAVGTPSIAGTWIVGGAGPQTWAITSAGGRLSGTVSTASGPISPISGSISGTSVTIVTGPYINSPNFTATFVGTLDASAESMSGTWSSTKGQDGIWRATRTSHSPTTTTPTPTPSTQPTHTPTTLPSATQVNCNPESPHRPGALFECIAMVSNASLVQPLLVPTGSVSFTVDTGGSGGFPASHSCNLVHSETGGNTSFCAVDYAPPASGTPIGFQPPITATYSGSSVFAASSAHPQSALPLVRGASASQVGPNVRLTMTCPSQTVCTGSVQMIASGAQASAYRATAAKTAVVASGGYSIAAGATAKVKLRLTSRGKALLKKHKHHLVVTLKILPKTGAPFRKVIVLR